MVRRKSNLQKYISSSHANSVPLYHVIEQVNYLVSTLASTPAFSSFGLDTYARDMAYEVFSKNYTDSWAKVAAGAAGAGGLLLGGAIGVFIGGNITRLTDGFFSYLSDKLSGVSCKTPSSCNKGATETTDEMEGVIVESSEPNTPRKRCPISIPCFKPKTEETSIEMQDVNSPHGESKPLLNAGSIQSLTKDSDRKVAASSGRSSVSSASSNRSHVSGEDAEVVKAEVHSESENLPGSEKSPDSNDEDTKNDYQ